MTDYQLLRRYARTRSGEAFRELVERHAGLVYSTCLRRLGDAHLAEDAAQAVFMVLAGKAHSMRRGVVLTDWLFKTARNIAANARRARERRRRREARLAEAARPAPAAGWSDLRPHLDAALAGLPAVSRSAVLLHYLQGKGHAEMAGELGCTPAAARMRARRGLARLRALLAGRGVAMPAAALAGCLAGSAIEPLPAGLTASISAACAGKMAVSGATISLVEETIKAMAWTKVKVAAAVLGAATVLGGGGLLAAAKPADEGRDLPAPLAGAPQATLAAVPAGAKPILTGDSYWRWHVTLDRPTYKEGNEVKGLTRKLKWGQRRVIDQLESSPPPAGWAKTEFDDSAWPRSRPKWCRWLAFSRFSTSQVCLRGKFTVANPAGAGLYLSAKYIGGAVVYLNGQEVHRTNMPKGKVTPTTWADPYAEKCYRNSSGKFLSMYRQADAAKYTEMRMRNMGPVKLPAAALKRGVNVLAIQLRRSSYPALCTKWFPKKNQTAAWPHADLAEVQLMCAGAGAAPNVCRPAGVQIWNHDRNDRVTVHDYGDPNEKFRPVKLVGAKNGSFCGQVVVGSGSPIDGVKATPAELKGPGGGIPAKNITVLYGRMDWGARTYGAWCDALSEKPPAGVAPAKGGGAVLPILFRVKVPKDAKPGEYKGAVSVTAAGKSFKVPVELSVADWTVPDTGKYRTYMGIYQSPTSLALQYKVDFWSEKHWKLIDRSFAHLARVGNKMINVPVVEETQFGNPVGMVRWIKKGDGWDHDFTVFDKYLDTAVKHCGKLDYVAMQIWHAGGWSHRKVDNKCTVTIVEEPGGRKTGSQQVPVFGTPESVDFWKPVLKKLQERLAKRGMGKAMCVGILSDSTAPNAVFQMFKQAAPGGTAYWHRGCHGTNDSPKPYGVGKAGGNLVSLHEHCYGMSMVHPDSPALPPIHTYRGMPGTAYFRVSGHESATTLVSYRTMPERGLFCKKQGIGRICLDFWDVIKGPRRGATHIYNRYPHSSCAQRQPTLKKMVWPGPDGAETTVRYEALCEGVQEADALMVISEGAANEARVGVDLAARCRKLIRDRLWYCHVRNQTRWARSYVHMNHHGWQELSKRTFEMAAEVSKKLGK